MDTVELIKILLEYKPSDILRERKEELSELIPEFKACFNFSSVPIDVCTFCSNC